MIQFPIACMRYFSEHSVRTTLIRSHCNLQQQIARKLEIIGNAFLSMNLIGQSPSFKTAIRNIRLISEFDVGVHIYGETGTGKELTAQAVHYLIKN